MSIKISLAFWS